MDRLPEVFEGWCNDDKLPALRTYKPSKYQVHKHHMPIKILGVRRIYDRPIKNFYFKSPNKVKTYRKVRVIIEYI